MKKRKQQKTCMTCGRISKRDLDRNFCPVTANPCHPLRPADKCIFYIDRKESGTDVR